MTLDYYAASTQAEKDKIHKKAEEVRRFSNSTFGSILESVDKFKDSISPYIIGIDTHEILDIKLNESFNGPATSILGTTNPYGAPGKPDHQQAINDLEKMAKTKYPNDIIHKGDSIKNQPNTQGIDRRPDVWVEDAKTKAVKEVFEAGRETKTGNLVPRELKKY